MDDVQVERSLYTPIKAALEALIRGKFGNCHLEITADRPFSETLKRHVPQYREIVFRFLAETRPDITGFVEGEYKIIHFVVVEVKRDQLNLRDLYQTRRYSDLLGAKYAALVTATRIPEELKRLCRVTPALYSPTGTMVLSQFDLQAGTFVDWHDRNPFE